MDLQGIFIEIPNKTDRHPGSDILKLRITTHTVLRIVLFFLRICAKVSEVDYATKAIITFITDCLQVNELPQFVNLLDLLSPIYFNKESPEFTIQSKHNVICENCLRVHWSWTPLCSIILYSVKSSISNFLV